MKRKTVTVVILASTLLLNFLMSAEAVAGSQTLANAQSCYNDKVNNAKANAKCIGGGMGCAMRAYGSEQTFAQDCCSQYDPQNTNCVQIIGPQA